MARDAVALTFEQKVQIQQGLNSLGYSTNGVDGKFGNGTRRALRAYQSDRGYKVNGLLSAEQASELIALSPAYAGVGPDDDRMFEIEFARDVEALELAEIQRLLNLKGYDAGPVDGKLGRRTINAILAYKRDIGVGGPSVPTRRLLAKLEGKAFEVAPGGVGDGAVVEVAGVAIDGDQGACTVECESVEEEAEVASVAFEKPEVIVSLDVLGARTGMTESDLELVVADNLETDLEVYRGTAADFGGDEILSLGLQLNDPNWPAPGSSTVSAYFDEVFPELGAFAITRTISLGSDLGVETVAGSIVPQIVEQYGNDGFVESNLSWVSDGEMLDRISDDPAAISACGALVVNDREFLPESEDNWMAGGGPKLDISALESVSENCGDVMSIDYTGKSVTMTLWNTDMLLAHRARIGGEGGVAEEPAVKIKF